MKFTTDYLKEKVGKFWDTYLTLLELKEEDIGKPIYEVPIVREMDIDENYSIRVGRNAARWNLVDKIDDLEIGEVADIDNIRRGLDLLNDYLRYLLYSQNELYEEPK